MLVLTVSSCETVPLCASCDCDLILSLTLVEGGGKVKVR